jgi:hypothetical protein
MCEAENPGLVKYHLFSISYRNSETLISLTAIGGGVSDSVTLKIGNVTSRATCDDVRKLKSILDEHRIFHIIDGSVFYNSSERFLFPNQIHEIRIWKAANGGSVSCKGRINQRKGSDCRKLIVPYLYKINFLSLIFLDTEEAEFLGDLIYGVG